MSTETARAIIVEDDRSWQQILSEILSDAGLTVDLADNFAAAIDALRNHSHRIAVIDLALGEGDFNNQDGIRVLDAIHRQDPNCVPIMLTGFATVELAVNVMTHHGAFSCLRKETFDRAEFRTLIGQALSSAPAVQSETGDGGKITPEMSTTEQIPRVKTTLAALVVEDDAGWRSILAELLQDIGYEVRLCNGFGEALGCLRREIYHLAVVDLSLTGPISPENPGTKPELEGYQVLSNTRTRNIPTIVVSGVAAPEEIEQAYTEQRIFAYLEKQTFNRQAFVRTVSEAQSLIQSQTPLEALTWREREVLELLARGMTNKEIGRALCITTNTVKRHLKAIFDKLNVHTRAAAVALAVNAGVSTDVTETALPNPQHPV
ncbi:MAG: response regulator [Anaerolineae bacterium]|nr:response regulator [Anaerolineae bacterium]